MQDQSGFPATHARHACHWLVVYACTDDDLACAEVVCVQASFDPPGLSIAVKKDRAVETLLVMGNKFNVNVLAQGKEKVRCFVCVAREMRHFEQSVEWNSAACLQIVLSHMVAALSACLHF